MSVRAEVEELVRLGPLVNEDAAIADAAADGLLKQQEWALGSIQPPATVEEARLLMKAFGPDDDTCFGLAWRLLHLIETAGVMLESEPPAGASWWLHEMWGRIERGKRLGITGPKPSAPPWPADPTWEPAPGQSVWLLDRNNEKLLRGIVKGKSEQRPGPVWIVHVGLNKHYKRTNDLRLDTGTPPPV